jgi:hypothetical protein
MDRNVETAKAEERLLGVLWMPERTGILLKRVCGAKRAPTLSGHSSSSLAMCLHRTGIMTDVCAIPASKFREHSSPPSHAVRAFAENRQAATSRRTCS